ncbi:Uncharacterised protein [Staphylococcus agnetis]|nr:Uncharacterised protein [Staphylococcus agnetis]
MHFHSLIEIDKTTRNILLKWLYNNVHNFDNPRLHGKTLQGELSNL